MLLPPDGRLVFRDGRILVIAVVNGMAVAGAPAEIESAPPPFLKLWPDVAKLLGLSKTLVYESAHRNELPIVKLGRLMLVPSAALEHMLRTGEQPKRCQPRR
jgi:excisionase family DNA binding protein